MQQRRQIDQVRKFSKSFYEIAEGVREDRNKIKDAGADQATKAITEGLGLESLGRRKEVHESHFVQEAIILAKLRPAYFVAEDGVDLSGNIEADPALFELIQDNKSKLDRATKSVGRIDLIHHWSLPYGGTGWLIDKNIAVTNRHVARTFGEAQWNGFRFQYGRFGERMKAILDFMHLRKSEAQKSAFVESILYIAGDQEADIAFLQVSPLSDIEPLTVAPRAPAIGHPVAAVGYPAEDPDRNDPETMNKLFGGIYEVKRFSPGFITDQRTDHGLVNTDYTSLGGNSGSPVIDLESGEVVALHFAGRFRDANYAVTSDIVSAALRGVKSIVPSSDVAPEAPTTKPKDLRDRNGYNPRFLGTGKLEVVLPGLGGWATDVAPVSDDADDVLKYENFSVIQSASRRLPLVTAVNIDGEKAKRLKRKGQWRLDGRIDDAHQIGNELYYKNPLDRGHMVRRRDPGWGKNAHQAEIDTFHYTNSVPQHEDLNQKDWVGLEDYILEAAETLDFKASIFTGPVFRDSDRRLPEQKEAADIQIPEEFWKIAVIVNSDTGLLSATGYVLSHGPLIRDFVESPYIYGAYKTYQVQIAKIEAETGLSFGELRQADPLGPNLDSEAIFDNVARAINGPESLLL